MSACVSQNARPKSFLHPNPFLLPNRFIRLLSSKLYDYYGLKPPLVFHSPPIPTISSASGKSPKPQFKPSSSLDLSKIKISHSDLPFDFRFSYTESSHSVRPVGLREPKYSPFGPGRLDREWTGICAPAISPRVLSVDEVQEKTNLEEKTLKEWHRIQGEPLTDYEKKLLVDSCRRNGNKQQVNIGRNGLTHNTLSVIHCHWKHGEAVRIRCMGVPTVDMNNICKQLEDKVFGKVIHRNGGNLMLYRGRNYDVRKRPRIPLMLWKPHEPVYPRLIRSTIDGLNREETKEMRKKGMNIPALIKLSKNGYYGNLVNMVRDAFLECELARIDCEGLPKSDYRKIGVKLRDLVPCVVASFDKEQVMVWRGRNGVAQDGHCFLDGLYS